MAGLDDNVRACVLLHLEPRDLANVAQTSRAMAREAEADAVWATLFLRRFGSDFWGEHVGPHPYHEVEAPRANAWLDMPAVAVFETFVHSVAAAEARPSGSDDDDDESETATRRALLAFVRGERGADSCGRQGGGWKRAYKRFGAAALLVVCGARVADVIGDRSIRMGEMVQTWQTFCAWGVLVAGETSFARLSAIIDTIKQGICSGRLRYMGSWNMEDPPLPSVIENVDVTSPAGNARVLRICVPPAHKWDKSSWTNICAVRRPRNWWNRSAQETGEEANPANYDDEEPPEYTVAVHFRGLKIGNWLKWNGKRYTRLHAIYAIDCERMADPDYQEQVFRELHGFLGEGKGQFEDGLFVNLHLINAPPGFGPARILERLKIPLLERPGHHCPFYAGPVTFVVTSFTMPPGAAVIDEEEPAAELIMQGLVWLSKQPMADRPHAFVRPGDNLWLCALSDARAEAERNL
ncbi:uncharacterized protein ACA1_349340 [Acanthamoeba castellanii str. Neff]|uniref:Fbox domain containing protein n=1 Tax=Acanthamoeba castellanii (strain ATCC 30010 / Neff) TaxID=1257118 RepID=L8GKA5_ACACF|nr:uncharacterized protein ACA1_349340 [Acanthamoeba castellanii str. Neff]ELR13143.1 hypothetical protein ACA1_349340 [Acanthamoeba castellanii str. Neff]